MKITETVTLGDLTIVREYETEAIGEGAIMREQINRGINVTFSGPPLDAAMVPRIVLPVLKHIMRASR